MNVLQRTPRFCKQYARSGGPRPATVSLPGCRDTSASSVSRSLPLTVMSASPDSFTTVYGCPADSRYVTAAVNSSMPHVLAHLPDGGNLRAVPRPALPPLGLGPEPHRAPRVSCRWHGSYPWRGSEGLRNSGPARGGHRRETVSISPDSARTWDRPGSTRGDGALGSGGAHLFKGDEE